jgi:hypothetical protein
MNLTPELATLGGVTGILMPAPGIDIAIHVLEMAIKHRGKVIGRYVWREMEVLSVDRTGEVQRRKTFYSFN